MHESLQPDPEILKNIVTKKMPFGKYKDRLIADLPIHYLEWFYSKGFPEGKLGIWLNTTYEIKLNGLDEIIRKLKELYPNR